MAKVIFIGVLVVVVAVFAGRFLFSSEVPSELSSEHGLTTSRRVSNRPAAGRERPRKRFRAELEGRSERPRVERRQVEVETERYRAEDEARAERRQANERRAEEPARAKESNVGADSANPTANSDAPPIDDSTDPIERALITGGLDPEVAAEVKRRYDDLEREERSLHVDAAAEDWLDSQDFDEEMDAIEEQRLAIRDQIGDTAYDHYIFAKGAPNRVFVKDVIGGTAEQAGLQSGDVIVRYGNQRIFSPDDLIGATSVGNAGEVIRVEIRRQDKRLELEVPAGPLDVQVGTTQDPPEQG